MTKCVILGGGGFIGSHLAGALLQEGHEVRVFERPNLLRPQHLIDHPRLEWLEGDFLNLEELTAAVEDCEVVYHLISTTLPKSSNENPVYDVETNIAGSVNLLELACREGIHRVVFISSGGTVYGVPRQLPIPESHPTDPLSSYGIAKLAIEKYLELYRVLHGLDYVVLRVANAYGEGQRLSTGQGAIAVFLDKALRDEEIEVWGDGSVVRDYVYVGDLARAFLMAMEYGGESRVFNVGSGAGLSLNELLEAIEKLLGRKVRRRYVHGRRFDVPVNVLDIARARENLGWFPTTSLEEGLRRTMKWMSQ